MTRVPPVPPSNTCKQYPQAGPASSTNQQPYLLTCGHAFCLGCLKEILRDKLHLTCYICKQVTSLSDFETFSSLELDIYCHGLIYLRHTKQENGLFKKLKRVVKEVVCSECKSYEATCRCKTCMEPMCDVCFIKVHSSSNILNKHKKVSLNDTFGVYDRSEYILSKSGMERCLMHNKPFEFFCKDDHMKVCASCLELQHKNHIFETIAVQMEENLSKFSSLNYKVREKLEVAKMSKKEMKKTFDTVTRTTKQLLSELQKHFIFYHSLLQCKEKQFKDEIILWYKVHKEFLLENDHLITEHITNAERIIRDVHKVLKVEPTQTVNFDLIISRFEQINNFPCYFDKNLFNNVTSCTIVNDESFKSSVTNFKLEYIFKNISSTTSSSALPSMKLSVICSDNGIASAAIKDAFSFIPVCCTDVSISKSAKSESGNKVKYLKAQKLKDVKKDIKVFVTHTINPSNFYIHTTLHYSRLEIMKENIKAYCDLVLNNKNTKLFSAYEIDDIVLTKSSTDNKWYRAIVVGYNVTNGDNGKNVGNATLVNDTESNVITINEDITNNFKSMATKNEVEPKDMSECIVNANDENEDQVFGDALNLFFMDYGNIETVPIKNIMIAPTEFQFPGGYARKCGLVDIESSGDKWSEEAIDAFKRMVSNRVMNMIVYNNEKIDDDEELLVDLIEQSREGFLVNNQASVRDMLVFLNLASFANISYKSSKKKKESAPRVLPQNNMPSNGSVIDSFILHVESPSSIFISLKTDFGDGKDSYLTLMNDIEEFYSKDILHLHTYICVSNGDICVAKYTLDNMWYRAKVINIIKPGLVEVMFIDYGNTETLSIWDIKKIKESFALLPAQAVECTLADVIPTSAAECTGWCPEVVEFLKSMKEEPVQCLVAGQEKDKLIVYLIRADKSIINQTIATKGWASAHFNLSTVLKKIQKTSKKHVKNYNGNIMKQVDVVFIISPELFYIRTPQQIGDYTEYVIAINEFISSLQSDHNESPSTIRKPEVLISNELCKETGILNDSSYSLPTSSLVDNELSQDKSFSTPCALYTCGDICLVYDSNLQGYARCAISQIDMSTQIATVYMMDHGSSQTSSLSSLLTLPDHLKNKPTMMTKCHLYNVTPAGGSKVWPKVATEAFAELSKSLNHKFNAIIHEDALSGNGGSLPIDLSFEVQSTDTSNNNFSTLSEYLRTNGWALKTNKKLNNYSAECVISDDELCSNSSTGNQQPLSDNPLSCDDQSSNNQLINNQKSTVTNQESLSNQESRSPDIKVLSKRCWGDSEEDDMKEEVNDDISEKDFNCVSDYSIDENYPPPPLLVSDEIEVLFTHLDNQGYFHFQAFSSDPSDQNNMQIELNNKCNEARTIKKTWISGQLVSCLYLTDGYFYRGKIIKAYNQKQMAKVLFVDYGNEEFVDYCNISPPLFVDVPSLGYTCMLHNYKWVMVDGVINEKYIQIISSIINENDNKLLLYIQKRPKVKSNEVYIADVFLDENIPLIPTLKQLQIIYDANQPLQLKDNSLPPHSSYEKQILQQIPLDFKNHFPQNPLYPLSQTQLEYQMCMPDTVLNSHKQVKIKNVDTSYVTSFMDNLKKIDSQYSSSQSGDELTENFEDGVCKKNLTKKEQIDQQKHFYNLNLNTLSCISSYRVDPLQLVNLKQEKVKENKKTQAHRSKNLIKINSKKQQKFVDGDKGALCPITILRRKSDTSLKNFIYPDPPSLLKGELVNCLVTYVFNGKEIYIQRTLIQENSGLNKMWNDMILTYQQMTNIHQLYFMDYKLPEIIHLKKDFACLVKSSKDGRWYRCLIVKEDHSDSKMFWCVKIIDYGHTEIIHDHRRFRQIPDGHSKFPRMSFKCIVDQMHLKNQLAIQNISQLENKNLVVIIKDLQENGTFFVDLYDSNYKK